jgi:hypothetical protein
MTDSRLVPLLVFCSTAALLLVPLPTPGFATTHPALFHQLENACHPIVFAIVALVTLRYLSRGRPFPVRRDYILTGVACVALGGLSELAQIVVQRDGSLVDFGNDLLGTAAALLVYGRSSDRSLSASRRGMALFVAIACVLVALFPLGWTCTAYANRARQVPILWRASDSLSAVFAKTFNTRSRGVYIKEPWPDWRGYRTLLVEVAKGDGTDMPLTIRVHDRDDQSDSRNGYSETFIVARSSSRTIHIPIERIQRGPKDRLMALDAITQVVVFTSLDTSGNDVIRAISLAH